MASDGVREWRRFGQHSLMSESLCIWINPMNYIGEWFRLFLNALLDWRVCVCVPVRAGPHRRFCCRTRSSQNIFHLIYIVQLVLIIIWFLLGMSTCGKLPKVLHRRHASLSGMFCVRSYNMWGRRTMLRRLVFRRRRYMKPTAPMRDGRILFSSCSCC